MLKVTGLFTMGIGVVLFWAIFFKLAPYVGSLIPSGDWTPLLMMLVYIIIVCLGGVMIPITIILFGAFQIFISLRYHKKLWNTRSTKAVRR